MVKIFVKVPLEEAVVCEGRRTSAEHDVFRLTRHSSRSLYPTAGVMPPQWWLAFKDSPMLHWWRACGRFGWPATETKQKKRRKNTQTFYPIQLMEAKRSALSSKRTDENQRRYNRWNWSIPRWNWCYGIENIYTWCLFVQVLFSILNGWLLPTRYTVLD